MFRSVHRQFEEKKWLKKPNRTLPGNQQKRLTTRLRVRPICCRAYIRVYLKPGSNARITHSNITQTNTKHSIGANWSVTSLANVPIEYDNIFCVAIEVKSVISTKCSNNKVPLYIPIVDANISTRSSSKSIEFASMMLIIPVFVRNSYFLCICFHELELFDVHECIWQLYAGRFWFVGRVCERAFYYICKIWLAIINGHSRIPTSSSIC